MKKRQAGKRADLCTCTARWVRRRRGAPRRAPATTTLLHFAIVSACEQSIPNHSSHRQTPTQSTYASILEN
eukprot:1557324-Rhodomonas_salina.1